MPRSAWSLMLYLVGGLLAVGFVAVGVYAIVTCYRVSGNALEVAGFLQAHLQYMYGPASLRSLKRGRCPALLLSLWFPPLSLGVSSVIAGAFGAAGSPTSGEEEREGVGKK